MRAAPLRALVGWWVGGRAVERSGTAACRARGDWRACDALQLRGPHRSASRAGRERLQSAGRARKIGSRFIEIIGATAAELALVSKSRREVAHLKTALAGLSLS